jgi:hypothetical protein
MFALSCQKSALFKYSLTLMIFYNVAELFLHTFLMATHSHIICPISKVKGFICSILFVRIFSFMDFKLFGHMQVHHWIRLTESYYSLDFMIF